MLNFNRLEHIMYLKKAKNKKTGRTYLSIAQGYRNPKTGVSTSKNIQSLGYLDELEKQYDDPITHFKEIAKQMTQEHNKQTAKPLLEIDPNETLPLGAMDRKNLGYAVISFIFHKLHLHIFLQNKQRSKNFKYNTYSIMLLLVISRILEPASKKHTFEEKGRYFERFDFSLHDVYRSLGHFSQIAKDLQRHLHDHIKMKYGRQTELVLYDVTNYHFEIDEKDPAYATCEKQKAKIEKDLRKRGAEKNRRPDPIIQMGLAADAEGIPIAYNLFEGNTNDTMTLRPMIKDLKLEYDLKRMIIVADKGVQSGDNINYITGDRDGDGYVISMSVRGTKVNRAFKDYVLDPKGYDVLSYEEMNDPETGEYTGKEVAFKVKSRIEPRTISVSKQTGGKMKESIDEKQVVFYSRKYALRAKKKREKLLSKANNIINNPKQYTKQLSKDVSKYIENLYFDEDGAVIDEPKKQPYLNEALIREEALYDGYYVIVTSEIDKSDQWVIDTYHNLWKIEDAFKLTKSNLEARPAFVSRDDHINAHFLSCFIALTILRLLQKETGGQYSATQLVDCMNHISCSLEDENWYLFDYRSQLSDLLGKQFSVDFSKKRLKQQDIKNILAQSKR